MMHVYRCNGSMEAIDIADDDLESVLTDEQAVKARLLLAAADEDGKAYICGVGRTYLSAFFWAGERVIEIHSVG